MVTTPYSKMKKLFGMMDKRKRVYSRTPRGFNRVWARRFSSDQLELVHFYLALPEQIIQSRF
jgi:hypothetical protein